jgi:hypothetical protein
VVELTPWAIYIIYIYNIIYYLQNAAINVHRSLCWTHYLLQFSHDALVSYLFTDNVEPDVTVLSLGVMSKGRPEITLQLPLEKNSNDVCFTLKEGSNYCLKVTFIVRHNIVSGLSYANTVWKGRIQGGLFISICDHFKTGLFTIELM